MIRVLKPSYFGGKHYESGDICELPAIMELRWIKYGFAERVEKEDEKESATGE